MAWDTAELAASFGDPRNADVLRYLSAGHPSAHDSVAEELLRSAAGLPGIRSYCPDPRRYAYVLLHTEKHVVFALAVGMSTLLYRLPAKESAEARSSGRGSPETGLDGEWTAVSPFQLDLTLAESRALMARWCGAAYRHALERER